ncbi:hypothetical protein [Endozoicomonas sp.]|uniref:hypothetical protein n=1 Tax=Endozoicomonas sp. TaxID=1892382 RepID=UPI0028850763|nr:hypothetical protein [Endozoicomonas sp.]
MLPIFQSLRFFSLYGVSLTFLFLLAAIPSEVIGFYLHQSLQGSEALKGGVVDLATSVLIEPLATGAAIYFIASRDQGGALSLYDSVLKSTGVYFQLVTGYLLVVLMVMVGLSLYLLPGFYLLYKLMFVEYRVALNKEHPIEAIRASFVQTRDQWSVLLPSFMVLLVILVGSQTLISYLLNDQGSDLPWQLLGGLLEAPFMAFSAVVGFRLFCLTSKPSL